jgi:hypothetical protein
MKRLILLVGLCAGLLATTQALASDAPPGSGGAVAGVSGKRALNDFAVHFHVKSTITAGPPRSRSSSTAMKTL